MEWIFERNYQKLFEYCQRSLEIVQKIVNQEFIEKTQPPIIIKEIRKKWINFFSAEPFYRQCSQCQKKCCSWKIAFLTMKPIELIYLAVDNPNFEFPKPDWQFLKEEGAWKKKGVWYPCLFLSEGGCLLAESKPRRCLFFVCESILENMEKLGLEESCLREDENRIIQEFNLWCDRIFGFLGVKSKSDIIFEKIAENYFVNRITDKELYYVKVLENYARR